MIEAIFNDPITLGGLMVAALVWVGIAIHAVMK